MATTQSVSNPINDKEVREPTLPQRSDLPTNNENVNINMPMSSSKMKRKSLPKQLIKKLSTKIKKNKSKSEHNKASSSSSLSSSLSSSHAEFTPSSESTSSAPESEMASNEEEKSEELLSADKPTLGGLDVDPYAFVAAQQKDEKTEEHVEEKDAKTEVNVHVYDMTSDPVVKMSPYLIKDSSDLDDFLQKIKFGDTKNGYKMKYNIVKTKIPKSD